METEKTYALNGELDNISFIDLSENELEISRHHVEITRHLQEIHHLFLILKYNISCFQKQYILKSSGDVFCNQKEASEDDDFIAINAHVTNIISAGRTLVESMECYANANAYINQGVKDKYLNFYHDVYDHSFSYRLLIRLRDFSQHGHLSVSCTRNNYYFDLIQIAEKPHFNHNKTLSQEIEKIIEEILSVYKDIPTFSLTNTIAEFIAKLFSIYNEFWNLVETELTKSCIDIQEVIKNNPCNIIDKQQLFSGLFIYEFIDGRLHVIPVNNGAQAMFERFKTEAESTYKEYKDAHSQLMEGSMLVRVVDGEQIQIKSGEDLT